MLYYHKIYVSEGIDVDKTTASKECNICYYWYFLNYSFEFQPNFCNRCHDLSMMSINLCDIAILNIKRADHLCITGLISKTEAKISLQNADLTEKNGTLEKSIYKNENI